MKKNLKIMFLAVAFAVSCGAVHADDIYPSKPIRAVVPYPPGGPADIMARSLLDKLSEELGQTIVIENKPGANSMIGTTQVARAAPDGYTLLVTSNVVLLNELVYRDPTYRALRDLTPIVPIAFSPYFLMVNSDFPAKTVAEYINYAKAHPGEVTFASAGTGGTPHLVGELFQFRTGVKLLHVPYKGSGPAANDLVGGQVQSMFAGMASMGSYVRAGKLRVLASAEEERSPQYPDIPTIQEEGFPGVASNNWYGVIGPAGLPANVVKRIADATERIIKTDEFLKRMVALGAQPMSMNTEQFAALYKADLERWKQVIQSNNLKINR